MSNSAKIDFGDLEKKAMEILNNYTADVSETMKEVVPQVAKEAVKKLKAESPKGKDKGSGGYAKGWTMTTQKGRLTISATVYGKKGTYNLAHLLEYGHAIKDKGGRKLGEAKAIKHIQPVEEWAVREVVNRTIERIEKI